MEIGLTEMLSGGRIVIPQNVRDYIGAAEGTRFLVTNDKNTIILKKIREPSKEVLLRDLRKIARENRRKLEAKGLTEKDVIERALR